MLDYLCESLGTPGRTGDHRETFDFAGFANRNTMFSHASTESSTHPSTASLDDSGALTDGARRLLVTESRSCSQGGLSIYDC